MEIKYLGYRFSAVKIAASCLWIWFADKRLWIQQTKHLQCGPVKLKVQIPSLYTKGKSLKVDPLRKCGLYCKFLRSHAFECFLLENLFVIMSNKQNYSFAKIFFTVVPKAL